MSDEETKKRKNKRQNVKHASTVKRYNSRIRQEYIDMDYLDQLDDTVKSCKLADGTPCTEMEFMSVFMSEWNNAGVTGIKDKTGEKALENKLHRTPEDAKICTDQNNARNRCEYSIAKAQNMVHKQDYETLQNWLEEKQEVSKNYTEEALIDILDEKIGNTTDNGDD